MGGGGGGYECSFGVSDTASCTRDPAVCRAHTSGAFVVCPGAVRARVGSFTERRERGGGGGGGVGMEVEGGGGRC